jgi:serine/threonine-protein kinase ULK/ATG1
MDSDLREQHQEKSNNSPPQYKYKIITKTPIGKGGFATVYQAVDKLGDVYAIKCIPLEKLKKNNTNDTDKFLLELDISMKMKHPNIVKSHEVFKTSKNWYIVCEYCDSGTLSGIIKSLGFDHMEREMVCRRYLTQLKNALKYLYRNNIVHRDIKPTNILLKGKYPHDTLKLADFGFSRYFESEKERDDADNTQNTQEFMMTSFCGTPLYMAPELLCNRKYTNKADLWSFGVIMYEMLYGVNPYNYPKSLNNLLDLIKNQEITFNNIYSNDCMNLLKSLLKVDFQQRINWEDFFKHPWFDKKIPSGFSAESLCGSSENIQNLIEHVQSPNSSGSNTDKKIQKNFKNQITEEINKNEKSIYDVNTNYEVNHTEMPEAHIEKCHDNDEFDVINKDEIEPCDYNTYKEEETYGFLQILSNSVYSIFGGKKRNSFP